MAASPSETTTRILDLVALCLERVEREGEGAIAAFCAEHPGDAPAIRERLDALRDAGILPDEREAVPERLGDFRLLERLGGGGMGVVHLAEQESLGRRVALKMMRPGQLYFPGARERFRREVESVARLQHPAIVPIYTVGEEDGVPFFAMEHLPGRSLAQIIAALHGRPPEALDATELQSLVPGAADLGRTWVEACFRIALRMAEALEHAHERGVQHRDVKPSNVMLTADGRIVLLDFGLASLEGDQRLTRTGQHVGSLPYMAPEQVLGETDQIGPWTDVYALGVTLYEALTLRSPFHSVTTEATRMHILAGEPPAPRSLNRVIPWDAETVCLKAIARDRRRRYASAADFARDLRNFLELRPIEAQRPGPWVRVRLWVGRHPARALTAVLALILVVVAPAVLAFQERAAGRRVEENFRDALAAVDQLLEEVGRTELRDVPQMEQVRARLLERAVTFYEKFLDRRGSDPALLRKAGILFRTHGEALQRLGRYADAEAQMRRGLAIAEDLVKRDSDDLQSIGDQAIARYTLGSQFRGQGRLVDAEREWRAGEQLQLELVRRRPGDPDCVTELARTRLALAMTVGRAGKVEEALGLFEQARDALLPLCERESGGAEALGLLASSWQRIGSMHYFANALVQAREAFTESIAVRKRLPEAFRMQVETRLMEAVGFLDLARVLTRLDEPHEAEAVLRPAIELCETLVSDFPGIPEHRRTLACARYRYSELLCGQDRFEEAEREARASSEALDVLVRARPEVIEQHSDLGIACHHLGNALASQERHEEAFVAWERSRSSMAEAIRRDPRDHNHAMRLVQVLSTMGRLRFRLGEKAVALGHFEEAFAMCSGRLGQDPDNALLQQLAAEQRRLVQKARGR